MQSTFGQILRYLHKDLLGLRLHLHLHKLGLTVDLQDRMLVLKLMVLHTGCLKMVSLGTQVN